MSNVLIRAALETALNAMSPPLLTALENIAFTPPDLETPYQEAFVLFAEPDNREIGPQYTQRGFLQVSLHYPVGEGSGDAAARAELIRTTFARGESFTSGAQIVTVEKTPEVMPAQRTGDRFTLVVRVRFFAQVTA